jgi:hypothetical protein
LQEGGKFAEVESGCGGCGERPTLTLNKLNMKNLAGFANDYIFALLSRKTGKTVYANAALVNRLRRLPFTEE